MKKTINVLLGLITFFLFSNTCVGGNITLISKNAVWKYLDNGTDQGVAWQNPTFDDSAWQSGATELGYGDSDEATVVSFGPDANNKYITTYFRKTFNVSNVNDLKSLLLSIRCDDGAVVYINGTEASRYNMPAGAITFSTLAPGNIGNQFELNYHRFNVPVSLLINGNNTIAVEVHQDDVTSSDLSFNFELIASTEVTIVAQGDEWKYLDDGSNQGTAWYAPTFDDVTWLSGKSALGYSTGANNTKLENTTISYGPNASTKYTTTYFRKNVFIVDTSTFRSTLSARIFIDDGAVVYVNGVEATRVNMPTGTIAYNTFANVTVGTAAWISININKNLLQNGNNVFAVEAHQVNLTSSDMFFELELKEAELPFAGNTQCSNPLSFNCYTAVPAGAQTGQLVIPSTHTFQYLMKQGDLYTNPIAGITAMPANNDYTAYLPINGSSTHGYLSVNHENNPGGVSMLEVNYNQYTGLWEVNNSQPVDFSGVVKTVRNCSGGITPWGTVITSEEDLSSGDANSDGYQDSGWHIEIDAVTKTIKDQDGNGTPDKLWALGRSTKENICFAPDSLTSYFGLDAGTTSYIYKFVADQKANLSSGTLYVLKQDVFLSNTAYWVQVPNTTQADRNNCQSLSTGLGARSFNKVEDVEYGPDNKIYFTSSNDSRIYRFSDNPSGINDFEIYVQGGNFTYTSNAGTSTGSFANCDNLVFDPEGNLYVNIDGNTNPFWVVRPGHSTVSPKVELFAKIPSGAESTGTTFSPDGKFMFVSIQHPNAGNTFVNVDAAGTNQVFNRGYTIVIARKDDLGSLAAIPFVELGMNQTVCQGQSVTIDAGAGHASYAWSTGEISQTITVSNPGTYSVTVTGLNGRTNTDNITINVNSLPTAPAVTSTNYCDGETILPLTATGTNIAWYSDAGLINQVATGNSFTTGNNSVGSSTYYATQTDANGCSSLASTVVETINGLPTTPVTNNIVACETTLIPSLTATGTTINWYSDVALTNLVGTGNSFNTGNTSAGTYNYFATQTDVNGCISSATTATLTINALPNVPVTSNESNCESESNNTLNALGTDIIWYSNAALTTQVGVGNNFTPTNSGAGIYTYYATQTDANMCVSSAASAILTINALPSAPNALTQTVCENETIPNLTATGTSINWYNDVALANLVSSGNSFNTGNTTPGTYTYYLTQTDANACTSLSSTVSLIINAQPSAPVITGLNNYCAGDVLQALIATGTNVMWYNDVNLISSVGSGNNYTPTTGGTYYATQIVNGCVSPSNNSTIVVNPLPTVNISGLNANYMSSDAAVSIVGTPAGGVFSGQGVSGTTFDPSVAGVGGPYAITYSYTDANGCTNSASTNVTVNVATSITTFANGTSASVYPNPANEQAFVSIQTANEMVVTISIYDVTGKEIVLMNKQNVSAGNTSVEINKFNLNLSNGTYWVKVSATNETKTIKVIFN